VFIFHGSSSLTSQETIATKTSAKDVSARQREGGGWGGRVHAVAVGLARHSSRGKKSCFATAIRGQGMQAADFTSGCRYAGWGGIDIPT
jgi:hypothetical protein